MKYAICEPKLGQIHKLSSVTMYNIELCVYVYTSTVPNKSFRPPRLFQHFWCKVDVNCLDSTLFVAFDEEKLILHEL